MRNKLMISNQQPAVLIVDDDLVTRRLIGRVMHRYFPYCPVEEALNGLEANDRLLTMNPPQLMILDLRMPVLGGLELCRMMQRQPWRYHTRVLAITGYLSPSISREVFQEGVSEFLPKPFQIEELWESINRLLIEN